MCTTERQRGFTLIELIIFIVVVSAGLAGILSVMNTTVASSADPMVRKQTVAIAESLLEEILLKEYANPPSGYSGTNRTQFDDVSDYAGYTSTGIVDMVGAAIPGLAAYNIAQVTVAISTDLTGVTSKKISVTVSGPGGDISLSGYRADY
ncbi:prepilin-type N-terminal cleavage/methylation domain-containing protein [Rhodoferax sp. 4810]|nr:prepilin-type N-terminal cleavage/methylation domain-containing protein [Rhodoferax jenense]